MSEGKPALRFGAGSVARRLAAVGLLVGSLLVAALLVWPSVLEPEVADGEVRDRMFGCVASVESAGPEVFLGEGVLTSCLASTLVFADRVGRLGEGVDALSSAVAAEPRLHDACHLASHRAGREIAASGADVPALLGAHPEMLCSWGLGHGLLEGFASPSRSRAEWAALAAACDRFALLPGDRSAPLSLCADGFGHAVWDASGDFYRSLSDCQLLTSDAAVSACAGGVMMQRFRPADTAAGRFGVVSSAPGPGEVPSAAPSSAGGSGVWAAAEVVDACARLDGFALPVVIGCASGAGYVLAVSLLSDRVALRFSQVSSSPPDALVRTALLDEVRVRVGEIWEVCERLGPVAAPEGVSLAGFCFDALAPYLPRAWGDGAVVSEVEELCSLVPADRRSACAFRP